MSSAFPSVPSHEMDRASSTSSGDSRRPPAASNKFGLACLRCRTRKVKCDGVRPNCANCTRKNFDCVFDVEPKRRGPDKQPGRKRRTAAQKKADLEAGHDPKAGGRPRAQSSASASGLQRLSPQSSPSPTADGAPSHRHHPASAPPKRRRSELVKSERTDTDDALPGGGHQHPIRVFTNGHTNGLVHPGGSSAQISSMGGLDRGQVSPISTGSSSGSSSAASFTYFKRKEARNNAQHGSQQPAYGTDGYGFVPHPNQLHHLPFPHPGYGQPPPPMANMAYHPNQMPPPGQHYQPHPQQHQQYHPQVYHHHPGPQHHGGFHGLPPSDQYGAFPPNGHHLPGPPPQHYLPPHQSFQPPSHDSNRGIAIPRAPYPLMDAQAIGHGNGRVAEEPSQARPDSGSNHSESSKGKRRATDAELDEWRPPVGVAGDDFAQRAPGDVNGGQGEPHRPWTAANETNGDQRPKSAVSAMDFNGLALAGKAGSPAQLSRVTSRPSSGNSRDSSASSAMITTPSASTFELSQQQQQQYRPNLSSPPSLSKAPSAEYPRQMWFDFLLSQFGPRRDVAYGIVVSSLTHLFKVSNHWLAFINIPLFIAKLHHPQHRQNLQPALVYAMLAVGSHMSSWEGPGGRGFEGRLLALKFKEQALAEFWSSWNSGWIDAGLAKAAFLMALYEASGNPLQSDARCASAMLLLDNVMRTLALPALDVSEPTVNMYPKNEVPDIRKTNAAPMIGYSSLGLHSEQSSTNCPFWAACPRWSNPNDPSSVLEIEKDETRRLVWASSALAASFSMYRYNIGIEPVELYLGNPENFALLYPGENILAGSGHDGKNSIWALYAATGMLWHFAFRFHLSNSSVEEKRAHALKVLAVSRNIEAMFDDAKAAVAADTGMAFYERLGARAYDWQARDWLLCSRMLVSDLFSGLNPNSPDRGPGSPSSQHRASARHWLAVQSDVAQCLHPLHPASKIARQQQEGMSLVNHRPVWIFWIIQQLSRALHLYEHSPESIEPLTVIREDFVPLLQFLLNLYPSEGLFDTLTSLTARLNEANHRAGCPEVVFHFPAVLSSEEVLRLMALRPLGNGAAKVTALEG